MIWLAHVSLKLKNIRKNSHFKNISVSVKLMSKVVGDDDSKKLIQMSQDRAKILVADMYKLELNENEDNLNSKFSIKEVRIKVKKNSYCNIPWRQRSFICTFPIIGSANIDKVSIIYYG